MPDVLCACTVVIMATSPGKSTSPRRNSSGLARDVQILELLSGKDVPPDGYGVVTIARAIGRDKAAVSRAMATLADAGLLSRDSETNNYRIGHRIFAMAARSSDATLGRLARPYLRRVAQHSRETAHLCILDNGAVLTTVTVLGPHALHTSSWEGYSTDPLRTPSGRVLLSDWSREDLGDLWSDQGDVSSTGTAVSPAPWAAADPRMAAPARAAESYEFSTLLTQIERVRERGFATSGEEFEPGVVAASAPVRDHLDRVVAAINVSAPKGRVAGHLDRLGLYVAQVAGQCSTFLGASGRAM